MSRTDPANRRRGKPNAAREPRFTREPIGCRHRTRKQKAEENELDPEVVGARARDARAWGESDAARADCPDGQASREVEKRVQAGDGEDLAHRVLSADDHEAIPAGFTEPLERADEHAEPGRVDEADAVQVERDLFGPQREHRRELGTQER